MALADPPWVESENRSYYRDLWDRTAGIAQAVELFREGLAGAVEVHVCQASRKAAASGRTVAVLAAVAVFLLLSAAVYGLHVGALEGPAVRIARWAALGASTLAALGLLIVLIKQRRV
jgi:Mg2+ and Co2+ transporter CorA